LRVGGTLHGPDGAEPAAGNIAFWPRRFAGVVVGPRRIALDVAFGESRLVLDADIELPPYLGITKPGRLSLPAGDEPVRVSIDAVQLLELWFRLL
jgi:hypothetical protein